MTREEFSKILRQKRDESGVTVKELCLRLDCLQNAMYNIEKAKHNYSLEKAIEYAKAVGAQIFVTVNNEEIALNTPADICKALISMRGSVSKYRASKDTGYYENTLLKVERGDIKCSIDLFLIYADYFAIPIKVISKQPQQ